MLDLSISCTVFGLRTKTKFNCQTKNFVVDPRFFGFGYRKLDFNSATKHALCLLDVIVCIVCMLMPTIFFFSSTTDRVMVNQLWQFLFGCELSVLDSPSFGMNHLLKLWLSSELVVMVLRMDLWITLLWVA